MEYVVFIYNALLLILFAVAATCYVIFYARTRHASNLFVSAMFALFIVENLILYMADFLESFAGFYSAHSLNSSLLKTMVSAGVFLCYIVLLCGMVRTKPGYADWVSYGVYVALLLAVPWLPTNRFTYWLYFTLSQAMLAFLLLLAMRRARALPVDTDERRHYYKLLRWFFLITFALNLAIVVEDCIVISFYDDLEALRINNRNVCEDVQSIFFGVVALWHFFKSFIYQPAFKLQMEPGRIDEYAQASEALRETKLQKLAQSCMLTERETEILYLLVRGKTNNEISGELFISLGTAKNHIHNIYRKTDAKGRGALIQKVDGMKIQP